MNENISRDLCEQKHKALNEKIDGHEKWLSEHDDKIDRLDRSDATNTQAIQNLCKQLSGQTKAIWGLVSMVGTALVGFFFYVIEKIIK